MRVDIAVKIGLISLGLLLLVISATADLSGVSINNTREDPAMGPIQISAMVISVLISLAGVSIVFLWRPGRGNGSVGEDTGTNEEAEREQMLTQQAYAAAERPHPPPETRHTVPMGMSPANSPEEPGELLGGEESLDTSDLEELELLGGLDDLGSIEDVDEYECPTCGHPVKFDDMECPYCGENFTDEYRCPTCGEKIEDGATVCPSCGEGFDPDHYDDDLE